MEELEAVSGLEFDYFELTMDPPQAHPALIRKQQRRIMDALDRTGMELVCHLPTFVSTADLTDGIREASVKEVLESLTLAAELQALKAVLHPSYISGLAILVRDQARSHAMKSLEAIMDKGDRLGLAICIENLFPRSNSLTDPEDFEEVLERFPSLMMTLDIGHAHLRSKGRHKAVEFIESFPDRIHHVHASDNFGKEDNHLPIGAGTVEFTGTIQALKNIGYDETVTFEVFSRDRDYLKISREKWEHMWKTG
jgi:sugar phosphate isomerase/epimerase